VGYYDGTDEGLIETLSGALWSSAEAPVPSGASDIPSPVLNSVACPVAGSCTAVGSYYNASAAPVPMIDTLENGEWAAMAPPLPANAGTSGEGGFDELDQAACGAAGACVALGHYTDDGGKTQELLETQQ